MSPGQTKNGDPFKISQRDFVVATHFFGLNDRTYRFSHTIGRQGQQGVGFSHLNDLTVGREGAIYVVNRSNIERADTRMGIRVIVTNVNEDLLGEFGEFGEGDGQFVWPTCIALDSQENVYITDEWLHRVSVFDKKGEFLGKWGVMGSGKGELNRPSGLAFDKEDNLYLVDSGNHRVQAFGRDGNFLFQFGSYGSGEGQFDTPWGITIDGKRDIYVADWRNDRVQKLAPDGKSLGCFGSPGELVGQFSRPSDVAVDKDGDIYVVDWLNHRVQVFTPEFRYITAFKGDATLSRLGQQMVLANPGHMRMYGLIRDMSPHQHFWFPVAVAVDGEGKVIIADGSRSRLQVYKKGEVLFAGYAG